MIIRRLFITTMMPFRTLPKSAIVLPGLLSLLLLPACYQEVDGCLDVDAENYELDADNPCPNDGCCEYPDIGVTVTHRWEGQTLAADSFYVDAFGNPFRINQLRYYWSELSFTRSGRDPFSPVDSVEFGLAENNGDTLFQELNANLVLINSEESDRQAFGTIRGLASIAGISGRLGLRDDYQRVIPSTAPSDSPLAFQAGKLYFGQDTGYVQLKLEYDLIAAGDTITREVNVFEDQAFEIDFGVEVALERGQNIEILLDCAVATLLSGINVSAESDAVGAGLAQNIPFVFSLGTN